MIPVLLCIALLVLSSAVVLRVVVDREVEPTGATPTARPSPERARRPQRRALGRTDRRRPAPAAPVATQPRPGATAPPRHRVRSSALLLVLAVLIGVVLAAVIGTILLLVAVGLRSAVTS